MILRISIFIFMIAFFSCTGPKTQEKKKDQLYIVNSIKRDTIFLDNPQFAPEHYTKIGIQRFCEVDKFCGEVVKFSNNGPTDGEAVCYQTKELGIIYTLNISWKSYGRLHSTNDSIEKRINEYLERILSRSELVIEGDIPLKYYDKIGPVLKMEK